MSLEGFPCQIGKYDGGQRVGELAANRNAGGSCNGVSHRLRSACSKVGYQIRNRELTRTARNDRLHSMRIYRLVIAALLALSFTVVPLAAGTATVHTASNEMSMGASHDDCPCCNAAHRCPADTCMLKCFNVSAIAVELSPIMAPLRAPFAVIGVTTLVALIMRPDPPPPRS